MCKDGSPALIRHDHLYYLAGWPDPDAMSRILSGIAERARLDTYDIRDGHRRRNLGDSTLHMNYGRRSISLEGFILESADIALIDNKTKERLL